MEEFAEQYPSHPAVAWVYDQLQPAYFHAKAWDSVMRVGALRLKIEPENLDAARLALQAADARGMTLYRFYVWADLSVGRSRRNIATPDAKQRSPDTPSPWRSQPPRPRPMRNGAWSCYSISNIACRSEQVHAGSDR